MDRQKMKVKVCLVGEGAVGKTCLIRRFIQDQFDDRYISTLGAKVSKKEIKVDGANGGMDVDMTIWDIMGEKGFRELLKEAYFHGAQGVLAVYASLSNSRKPFSDRKSTRLNSSHDQISYAVFCLKKK